MILLHRQQAYNVSYCFLTMNVDVIETLYVFRKADVANLKGYIQCRIADRVPGDIEGEGCCRCRTSAQHA